MRHGTIVLDPGHGGNDSGAVGPTGLRESDTNLRIAGLAAWRLTEVRFPVMLTRTADDYYSLKERASFGNADGVAGLVSVHCNSNGASANGFEVYHWPHSPSGIWLAESIRDAVARDFPGLALRGDRRGLKADKRLAMLRLPKCPSVLVELAFISNPVEEEMLRTQRDRFAFALASGICGWLGAQFGAGEITDGWRDAGASGEAK